MLEGVMMDSWENGSLQMWVPSRLQSHQLRGYKFGQQRLLGQQTAENRCSPRAARTQWISAKCLLSMKAVKQEQGKKLLIQMDC